VTARVDILKVAAQGTRQPYKNHAWIDQLLTSRITHAQIVPNVTVTAGHFKILLSELNLRLLIVHDRERADQRHSNCCFMVRTSTVHLLKGASLATRSTPSQELYARQHLPKFIGSSMPDIHRS
jgi:hypothetical protein